MTADLRQAYAECGAIVARDDRDRWLASLFIPADKRPHIHALYAFSLEIARVRPLVSEPMLGEIRFQWWREILAGERVDEAAAHPVAAALTATRARCDLPLAPFLALIDARLFDLYDDPMPSLEALEAYARATAGQIFALAAMILDPRGNDLAEASTHAGIAYAVTGLLRALPWHAATGQVYVPKELLERHGALVEAARAAIASPALCNALAELRALARGHLDKFAATGAERNGPAGTAFLPLSLSEAYLRQMEKRGYQPFETVIQLPQWRRQWRLWRAARAIG